MLSFIEPHVQRDGLRKAMKVSTRQHIQSKLNMRTPTNADDMYFCSKSYFIIINNNSVITAAQKTHCLQNPMISCLKVLNQQFPERSAGAAQVNDTDSEKQRRDYEEDEEVGEEHVEEQDNNDNDEDVDEDVAPVGGAGAIVAPGRELRNR